MDWHRRLTGQHVSGTFQSTCPQPHQTNAPQVLSLSIDFFGLPMECLSLGTFEQKLYLNIFAPLGLMLAIAVGCAAATLLRPSNRRDRSTRELLKAGLVRSLPVNLLVSFLAFPMVSSRAFQAFSCEDFDNGSSYLRVDYRINCSDAIVYGPVLRLAGAAILLYPIAVPLTYALLLYAARDAILSRNPSTLSRALSFLHRDFEPRTYWWEIAEVWL